MLIDINKIIVNDRIRKDFGNLEELAEDIKQNGLINPPTINKDYVLLAGERRLRACKSLGWGQIPVHMLDTKDEAHDLAVEMSENNLRRNFTGSELAEGIRRQMALESKKAKERMADGGRGANICTPSGKSRDKAAEQFGISGEQARKTLFVDDHKDLLDPADFAEWDEGKLSTNKAFQRIKAAMEQAKKERDEAREDLEDAYMSNEVLEREIDNLKQKVSERPEPKVIEREVEVVREVVPEETKRRMKSLEHYKNLYEKDNATLRKHLEETRKELDRTKGILNMGEGTRKVQNDVEYLIAATNQYVRNYGGLTWTFEQIANVDEITREELRKAVKNLATFSSALVAGLEQM